MNINANLISKQIKKENTSMRGKIRVSQIRSKQKLQLKQNTNFIAMQEKKIKQENENNFKIKINNKTFLTIVKTDLSLSKVKKKLKKQQHLIEVNAKDHQRQINSNIFQNYKLQKKLKSYSEVSHAIVNGQGNISLKNIFQQYNKISNMGLKIFKMPQNVESNNFLKLKSNTLYSNSEKLSHHRILLSHEKNKGNILDLKNRANLNNLKNKTKTYFK